MSYSALLVICPMLVLIAIWIGYPLAIGLIAAVRNRRGCPLSESSTSAPLVSVVIATREHEEVIANRLSNVLATGYERLEVVVGLDGNAASATRLLAHFPHDALRLVAGDAPGGKAATLNAAVRAARGDIIVFTDAHQRFERETITDLVGALGDREVGAVSGSLHASVGRGRMSPVDHYWQLERWLRAREAIVHSTVGVTGAVFALRRELWQPLPPGLILDDVYTPMRLVLGGYRVAFSRSARAIDDRRFTAVEEYRRKVRTLTGVLQLCAWLPEVLVPWRNPVWTQFVFHKLLRLLTPYLLLVAFVGVVWTAGKVLAVINVQSLVAVALVVASLALLPHARRRLRRATGWFFALQAAVVVSMTNGLRGRWDVWR